MFTGIIECLGKVVSIETKNETRIFKIESLISNELKVDQSVAHNGVCLTVTQVSENIHQVCAVEETLSKTTLGLWKIGDVINLERCTQVGSRLDGHIVQGHVDTVATCLNREDKQDNWKFTFAIPKGFEHLIIEKGSITVNGTSLTCFNVTQNSFEIAIIPYTFENTSIHLIHTNDLVNLEFDVVGKYISRMQEVGFSIK